MGNGGQGSGNLAAVNRAALHRRERPQPRHRGAEIGDKGRHVRSQTIRGLKEITRKAQLSTKDDVSGAAGSVLADGGAEAKQDEGKMLHPR